MENIGDSSVDTLKMVLTRFHRSEEYCSPWHEKMKDWYKRYKSYSDPFTNPYQNNVFDPLTFTLVETHVARMMMNLFAVSPFLSIIPVDSDADPEIAKQLEKCLAVINDNPEAELFLELQDWEKQDAIMGTSYLNVLPKFDFRATKKKSKKKRPYFFDGIIFETQEAMDVFPDPAARRISKCKYLIKRDIMYYEDMVDMMNDGIYNRNVLEVSGDESNIDDRVKEKLNEIGYTTWDEYFDPITGRCEVLTYFQDGHIINIAARKAVIRDTREDGEAPLPHDIPMIDSRFCAVPGEFFGMGIPEMMRSLQDSINLIESQRLDNIEMILNKMWIYRVGGITSPEDLVSFPGNSIPVEQQGDVEPVEFNDILGSAYEEVETKKYAAQDAVGELELARGSNVQNERTATGIMRLQEATLIRNDQRVKQKELSGIRRMGKKELQLIRKFCPQEQYERIIGEPDKGFYKMELEDIFDLYDVKPVGSSVTANKELRAYQVQTAQEILMNIPPEMGQNNPTPFVIDYYEVLKMGLDPLDIKNFDEIVKKIPEEELAMQQQQQMQEQPPQGQLPPEMGGGGQPGLDQMFNMMQQSQQPQPQQPQAQLVPMPQPILPEGMVQ